MLRGVLERGGFEIIGEATNGEEGYLKYKELADKVRALGNYGSDYKYHHIYS